MIISCALSVSTRLLTAGATPPRCATAGCTCWRTRSLSQVALGLAHLLGEDLKLLGRAVVRAAQVHLQQRERVGAQPVAHARHIGQRGGDGVEDALAVDVARAGQPQLPCFGTMIRARFAR